MEDPQAMTDIILTRSAIDEWGIYTQIGVITLGLKYLHGAPLHTLIIQLEEDPPDPADDWLSGPHLEIDETGGGYGGVRELTYNETDGCIRLALNPAAYKDISVIQMELPQQLSAEEQQLLRKLAMAYQNYSNLRPRE